MTLVMAEKDQPVFRDFLGLDRGVSKQPEYSTSDVLRPSRSSGAFDSEGDVETFVTKVSSGTSCRFETSSAPEYVSPSFGLALPSSSDPGSVGWQACSTSSLQHHGIRSAFCKPDFDGSKVSKKRDYTADRGRESLQERLQISVEAMENSLPPQKMTRVEQHKCQKYAEVPPSIADLRLSTQPPPRLSSVNPLWLQQASKPDVLNRNTVHSNSGLQVPRISHLGACAEREERAVAVSRENTGMSPPITRPAADEGSRTGLKGSPLVGLINSSAGAPVPAGSSGPPPPLPRRPTNSSASGGGSDSMLPTSRQGPPPASRQLTIFYGGQAHVFDNVPSDKAEYILALAGSHGKSWSTTYLPRPAASVPSASEGSLSALEKEKTVQSQGGSGSGRRSLPLSPDVQTLLRGYANAGNGTGCPS